MGVPSVADFYRKSIDDTLKACDASSSGLSETQAAKRLLQNGKNTLPESKRKNIAEIFIDQFKSPIIYVLMIAAIASFAIGEYTDGWFIVAVLVINAVIGTYQEYTAGIKAESLKNSVKTYAFVRRDGHKKEIISEDLVVGDIVLLESGSKIPADLRLVKTNNLLVNESLLTGESTDVLKDDRFIAQEDGLQIGDRKNMTYNGSFVTKGRGEGIVTAVGVDTEVGKIASLLAKGTGGKPPLVERMEKFSVMIAKIIGTIVVIMFVIGYFQGQSIKELFFFSVALAVSSIPEGLPVAIVVALTAASLAMSKRNVIVRKLASLEGLGSCTLIASDKTGTLTQNELSVSCFIDELKEYKDGESIPNKTALKCALLANEVDMHRQGASVRFKGDQVDIALAKWAVNLQPSFLNLKKEAEILSEIPYEPENRYSAIKVSEDGGSVFIKGSPEVVLASCDMDEERKARIERSVKKWASQGYRNIALAYKTDNSEDLKMNNFEWLGFVAIIDPLRKGVKEAVEKAKNAGIKVVMITGDHPDTALSIAKELSIANDKNDVIDGLMLQQWERNGKKPEEISSFTVFARISPEQKQMLVVAFEALGHFVAVTGDGVNDAPALKYANIGIAMGKNGTDVARDSSDLILTDDHFASIVNGIEEGRVAYDNIRKVIYLLISTGFAEIVLVTLSIIFQLPMPLLPVQLLWLNLVTNGVQDVALGLEKKEPGIIDRKPRSPKEKIFNPLMVRRVLVGGLYMGMIAFALFYWLLSRGMDVEEARNMTLLMMVLFENVHAINSRSEVNYIHKINHFGNKLLPFSILIAQSIHIVCMHLPYAEEILGIMPVSPEMWLMLLAIALSLTFVMEFDKYLYKRRVHV